MLTLKPCDVTKALKCKTESKAKALGFKAEIKAKTLNLKTKAKAKTFKSCLEAKTEAKASHHCIPVPLVCCGSRSK